MDISRIQDFQSMVENSDICVIPIWARQRLYSKSVQHIIRDIYKLNTMHDSRVSQDCIALLDGIFQYLKADSTEALQLYKKDKWCIFIRPDQLDLTNTNVLSLGENKIALSYVARNVPFARMLTQIINLKSPMNEYPDDWSGFVSVWDSYQPFLTIVPEKWHLDIHYIH